MNIPGAVGIFAGLILLLLLPRLRPSRPPLHLALASKPGPQPVSEQPGYKFENGRGSQTA
jgi:hypothetical protein